ncbi:hypothetical protein [Sphingomonas sp. 3-13AW]|uniref:hypothetical protein n=1 Tax=Sphingomonas sp. 3-13AW TaxID=3050450 RepID=UPI003BB5887B
MSLPPHVVGLAGGTWAVVVPDWHTYHSLLGLYCGTDSRNEGLPRECDLYILCHDAQRAAEVHTTVLRYPYVTAKEITVARAPTYREAVQPLVSAGHAVVFDTFGPDCDDARLKRLHPAPEGPAVNFQWNAKDKCYRMSRLTATKDGSTSLRRIVLRDGPDWEEQVEKGYRRFAKLPAPKSPTLTCLPHVAQILSRLDWHGACRLERWRSAVERAGIEAHHTIPPLVIAAATIATPRDLLWLELKAVRSTNQISARCVYYGDTSIVDRTLTLTVKLPETVLAGVVGLQASKLWGEPDLDHLIIRHHGKDGSFTLVPDVDVKPLPSPVPPKDDEQVSLEMLKALEAPADLRIEGVVFSLLAQVAPSARLHLFRTLLSKDACKVDISPWLPLSLGPVIIAREQLLIHHFSSGYHSPTKGIHCSQDIGEAK